MNHSKPHILVISRFPAEDPEFEDVVEYEIEHNADCPLEVWTRDPNGIPIEVHTCDVGHHLSYAGLDDLTWPESVHQEGKSWEDLPEGRYVIQTWSLYDSYSGEWDGGMEILSREGDVVAT